MGVKVFVLKNGCYFARLKWAHNWMDMVMMTSDCVMYITSTAHMTTQPSIAQPQRFRNQYDTAATTTATNPITRW